MASSQGSRGPPVMEIMGGVFLLEKSRDHGNKGPIFLGESSLIQMLLVIWRGSSAIGLGWSYNESWKTSVRTQT